MQHTLPPSAALQTVINRANTLAHSSRTFSVTFNSATPPSHNPQDYTSTGPYWWPNPNTPNGLPWVRKDGVVNRLVRGPQSDSAELSQFITAMATLATAYADSKKPLYAQRAYQLINVFLLDERTGMNPNMRYAQAIPGITDGRGIGIIESRKFITLLQAHEVLLSSEYYRTRVGDGVNRWVAELLTWLKNSPNGIDESRTKNNHASFYDYQLAYFAHVTGSQTTFNDVLAAVHSKRIATQINPGGKQPHELARTRPYHYSVFNLEAFWGLAVIAKQAGQLTHVLAPQQNAAPLLVQALDYINQQQSALASKGSDTSQAFGLESLIRVNLIAGQLYHHRFTEYATALMQQHHLYDCLLAFPVALPQPHKTHRLTNDSGDGLCHL
jgi:hypothetical protein